MKTRKPEGKEVKEPAVVQTAASNSFLGPSGTGLRVTDCPSLPGLRGFLGCGTLSFLIQKVLEILGQP